ncbi:hypothetical protein ACB092_11G273200 [Castanea dentata]
MKYKTVRQMCCWKSLLLQVLQNSHTHYCCCINYYYYHYPFFWWVSFPLPHLLTFICNLPQSPNGFSSTIISSNTFRTFPILYSQYQSIYIAKRRKKVESCSFRGSQRQ